MVFTNVGAFFDVLENFLILKDALAPRTRKEQHFKYLLYITVEFLRSLFAPTSVDRALPSQLNFDAILTEQHVALWTL